MAASSVLRNNAAQAIPANAAKTANTPATPRATASAQYRDEPELHADPRFLPSIRMTIPIFDTPLLFSKSDGQSAHLVQNDDNDKIVDAAAFVEPPTKPIRQDTTHPTQRLLGLNSENVPGAPSAGDGPGRAATRRIERRFLSSPRGVPYSVPYSSHR